jgi:hypothetical protein
VKALLTQIQEHERRELGSWLLGWGLTWLNGFVEGMGGMVDNI